MCGTPPHLQVFTIQNQSDSIGVHVKGDNGWAALDSMTPKNTPMHNTPIAAISWVQSDVDQVGARQGMVPGRDSLTRQKVRLYYVDTQGRINEIVASCTGDGTSCKWNQGSAVLTDDTAPPLSPTSGLAAVHWGNKTLNANNIRVYYSSTSGILGQLAYLPPNWTAPDEVTVALLPNASIAAAVSPLFQPVSVQVFYQAPSKQNVWAVDSDQTSYGSSKYVAAPDTYGHDYALTSLNSTGNDHPGAQLDTIDMNGDVFRQIYNSQGAFEGMGRLPAPRADDPGGPIAALRWDEEDQEWLFYAVDGSVTEVLFKNGTWSQGASLH